MVHAGANQSIRMRGGFRWCRPKVSVGLVFAFAFGRGAILCSVIRASWPRASRSLCRRAHLFFRFEAAEAARRYWLSAPRHVAPSVGFLRYMFGRQSLCPAARLAPAEYHLTISRIRRSFGTTCNAQGMVCVPGIRSWHRSIVVASRTCCLASSSPVVNCFVRRVTLGPVPRAMDQVPSSCDAREQ